MKIFINLVVLDSYETRNNFFSNIKHYVIGTFQVVVTRRVGWTRFCLISILILMFFDFINVGK